MVGSISIIIITVISFAMMMEGWEKYDSQKFYTGLLVIGISIIMIFPVMQYNMENMKNVYKFNKLNEMKLGLRFRFIRVQWRSLFQGGR